ncbi:MAG TPA: glycosyltransferase family 4 protein, partial [Fibrobacteria bacterium]|nr:glycosyltransferase family 4 protein [Fibrobacteria bacterium]
LPGVTRVIPCMLPGDPDPAKADRAARTAHPSLLFLGSRGSRKRGELALELHRALRARFPSLTLTYVGPPPECAALRGTPGTEGVEFLSRLDQESLLGLYRRSWIYLCLSSYEGFGVGLIEAMACGCVAFTTPHPGADFLVRNGDNGLVAAPSEAGSVLARVLAEAGEREAIAARGMAEAWRYAPRAVAGAYLELYRLATGNADADAKRTGEARWA